MDTKRLLPQMIGLTLVTLLLVNACGASQPTPTPTPIPPTPTATSTPEPTATPTVTLTSTPTFTPTATSTATPTATPTSTPTPTPVPVHDAVKRVGAFHEAINAIEPGKEEGGKIEIGKGLNTLIDIFREHTTRVGLSTINPLIVAMGSGMVRFSNMEYELVSESAECVVVRASGEITIGEETGALDEKYVVVKQGEKWLIKLSAKSCD